MEHLNIYNLGIKAKNGDTIAMMEIIERKKSLIKKFSYGDEDAYQYIILKLIEGIKKYKF